MATEKKRYKLAPPDGGYGYAIVVAASVNLMTSTMFMVSFGMIYHDFFVKLKMGSTSISVLTGLKAICMAISGFLTGPLAKMMSKRQLALLACLFFNAGCIGLVFVNTKVPFFICQGILQSIGTGFLMNISLSIVTDYFVERRMLFMAFIHVMSCGSSIVAPILVTYCMAEYGYQGTLMVMSSVAIQSFAACTLIQPVGWHMKRVRVQEDRPEKKLLLHSEDTLNTVDNMPSPEVKETDDENMRRWRHRESIAGPGIAIGVVGCDMVTRYVDWPLFRRYAFTSLCLGMPLATFADITYLYFFPPAMYTVGWDKNQVKWALALLGFGDITCRAAITLFSELLKKISSHWLYLFGVSLSIATKLALLWVRDYTSTLVIISIMGVSRSMIIVLSPLVLGDYSGPEKFPSVVGISFMMFGLVSIVLGPVIGAIAEAAQSHTIMFEILIGVMAATVVAWLFEIWRNNGQRRQQQRIQK